MERRRRSTGSLRVRTTILAVLVVGLALSIGSTALVIGLGRSLTSNVRTSLELRAADIAAALRTDPSPGPIAVDDAEDAFVQVIDRDGIVVASSPNLAGTPPVARMRPGTSAVIEGLRIDEGEYLTVASDVTTSEGRFTILAGRSLDIVEESTGLLRRNLLLFVPLLVLLVGLMTWRLSKRALAPVEAMRRQVEEISAAEMHRRVPAPAGDDEIARLAATMNRMLQRLEEAQARQRRLISDASHELRSPIATIRHHAEVTLAHPEQGDAPELAQVVLEEGIRLQRLVEDLLLLARADERRVEAQMRPVDLDDIVFDEASRLRATTALRIETTEVTAGRVTGDVDLLRRLIRNLADNAARHASTTIAFSLAPDASAGVILRVDDDGPGVPQQERARIFERFVRLDEARSREAGGSGLGLSIVAEIASVHGGSVTVADAAIGGARFQVRLPS